MNYGSKKLSKEALEEIQANKGRGGIFYKDLAKKYGVHVMTINYYASQSLNKKVKEARKRWNIKNKDKIKENSRKRNRLLKIEVLNHYKRTPNLECECCKENKIEFLSIDHINKDGRKHRRSIRTSLYLWVKRNNFPNLNLRVLCMNCNHSYGQYNYCPHKDMLETMGLLK